MKKIILTITLSLLMIFSFTTLAKAAITDGVFGINQIFDVQYYWSGSTLHASNFIAPYDMNFQTVTATSGQYFQFFESTTNPGSYGLKLMNADGTLSRVIHDHGDITALGDGAIFYIGSGFFGNVISTAQGYAYGASGTFENMDTDVTQADLQSYTYASSTPLTAGQTATPPTNTGGGGGGSVVTPSYASSITAPQLLSRAASLSYTTGNNLQLSIVGNSNNVDVQQLTAGNYANIDIQGSFNNVDTLQTSNVAGRHYMEMDLLGNSNTINVDQKDAAKTLFFSLDGRYNNVDILQQGAGESYINLSVVGDDGVIDIVQEGAGDHAATIELENAGGVWNFNLTQSSNTNLVYSLPHNLSDNTVVTGVCYTGTCSLVVNQTE